MGLPRLEEGDDCVDTSASVGWWAARVTSYQI